MAAVITIDGPSGVGKGTLTQRLARRLAWGLLDSGALYRILAVDLQRQAISEPTQAQLQALIARQQVRFVADSVADRITIFLNDHEVTDDIRAESVGKKASTLAAQPLVRAALLDKQRQFCQSPGLVADGRDMGTVVFPEAALKIFLSASAQVRAKRRYKQLKEKGINVSLTDLLDEINARDARDSQRAIAPLLPAADAVLIDSSELSIEQVVDKVLALARQRDLGVLC